jgi:putative intracellular protease/amidase
VTDASGESIFKGKTFTGFSNEEEEQVKMVDAIPFLLETKITSELGGKFVKADQPWGSKVVVDGKLVTGQNPASAKEIAETLVKLLA